MLTPPELVWLMAAVAKGDQARERVAENAREQVELDRIGAMRPAAMRV